MRPLTGAVLLPEAWGVLRGLSPPKWSPSYPAFPQSGRRESVPWFPSSPRPVPMRARRAPKAMRRKECSLFLRPLLPPFPGSRGSMYSPSRRKSCGLLFHLKKPPPAAPPGGILTCPPEVILFPLFSLPVESASFLPRPFFSVFNNKKRPDLGWKPDPVFAVISFSPPGGGLSSGTDLLSPGAFRSKPSIGFQNRRDQGIIIISLVAAKREFKHEGCVYPGNHRYASPFPEIWEHDTAKCPDCQGDALPNCINKYIT